jgi:hypothetical protein
MLEGRTSGNALTQQAAVCEHLLDVVTGAAQPFGVEELPGGARVQSSVGPEPGNDRVICAKLATSLGPHDNADVEPAQWHLKLALGVGAAHVLRIRLKVTANALQTVLRLCGRRTPCWPGEVEVRLELARSGRLEGDGDVHASPVVVDNQVRKAEAPQVRGARQEQQRTEHVRPTQRGEKAQNGGELHVVHANAHSGRREQRVARESNLEAHVLDRIQSQHVSLSAPGANNRRGQGGRLQLD